MDVANGAFARTDGQTTFSQEESPALAKRKDCMSALCLQWPPIICSTYPFDRRVVANILWFPRLQRYSKSATHAADGSRGLGVRRLGVPGIRAQWMGCDRFDRTFCRSCDPGGGAHLERWLLCAAKLAAGFLIVGPCSRYFASGQRYLRLHCCLI